MSCQWTKPPKLGVLDKKRLIYIKISGTKAQESRGRTNFSHTILLCVNVLLQNNKKRNFKPVLCNCSTRRKRRWTLYLGAIIKMLNFMPKKSKIEASTEILDIRH